MSIVTVGAYSEKIYEIATKLPSAIRNQFKDLILNKSRSGNVVDTTSVFSNNLKN